MKMTADEDAVYMRAFGKSKGKTVKDRMAEADAALKQFRAGGMERAVNNGIKDGTLSERAKSRREKINEAIDG
jgi:hypothetical protein